ncbi:hypothetical protein CSB45_02045 [candidate division KSB3 bacterium]|uniref:Glycosyltransferase RgtA/B/C/D-like domain-containing protein n=1 Tax=candidate division KSB3 bacterium TaxID=2044937 RepID=A0A2G6E9R9_9BACT|nr:MAG: hypothetical protein CSB45_02045 [candidate division KSB3 bacterium]PIE30865.1 MAG: hypothetical protein CSA57_00655 [candidate division KSB3 bacterium]
MPVVILLAMPVMAYLTITLLWRSNNIYRLSGDEPHYLLITESLIEDGDLRLNNNYADETIVSQEVGGRLLEDHIANHVINGFSMHNIGLSVLLAIPYYLGGVIGAKLFLSLLFGIALPFLFYKTAHRIIESSDWAIVIAFVLSMGLPFIIAHNQIYPDLLAGIISLHVIELFLAFQHMEVSQKLHAKDIFSRVLGIIEIAFLPWLHIRFLSICAVFLLFLLISIVTKKILLRNTLIFGAIFTIVSSYSLLCLYNYIAFQNFLGPYQEGSLSFDLQKVAMIFGGLFWDGQHGIFLQQPFILLGLLGLPLLFKENWEHGVFFVLAYLAIVLPNAMHPNWYGGYSFVGRFGWAGATLWIFPVAYGVRTVLKRKWGASILLTLCIGSLSLQCFLSTVWIFYDKFLYNTGIGPSFWAGTDFYTTALHLTYRFQYLLPSFKDFSSYFLHWPNYVWGAGGLLLILSAYWLGCIQKANRFLCAIWSVFIVISLFVFFVFKPAIRPLTFTGKQLSSQIGSLDNSTRIAHEGEKGFLIFGPFLRLTSGEVYTVSMTYQSSSSTTASWDVALNSGRSVIAQGVLPASETNDGIFAYTFSIPRSLGWKPIFEFRVYYNGTGELCVRQIEIKPVI